jgi:hypothetical protein
MGDAKDAYHGTHDLTLPNEMVMWAYRAPTRATSPIGRPLPQCSLCSLFSLPRL